MELFRQASSDTWKEGGTGRSILYAGVGGLLTGDIGGVLGAGATSLAAPYLEKTTENLGTVGKVLVNTAGAAALGYTLGGHSGALTGSNADWNNRQLHPSETRVLTHLKKGKSAEEQHRLNAAACALVRCAEGVPASDPYYRQLSELQKSGEKYQTEKNLLLKSGKGLFKYGFGDGANDLRSSYDRAITKTKGIVNTGIGTVAAAGSVAAGGALCTTGIGCVGGASIATLGTTGGYAQSKHGLEQLLGTYRSKWGTQVIASLNSPVANHSPLMQDAVDISLWSAETLVGRKFSQLTGQKSIDRYIELQKRQSSVLPDHYIYDAATKTFIGPKGGRSIATTYQDSLGNTVYRRIDGSGQLQNNYYVVGNDGRQLAVKNPVPTVRTAAAEGLNRPGLRVDTERSVYSGYIKLPNGDYLDKIKGTVIKSPVHIGHVHGWENRRLLKAAKELGMTQKQLNDYVNDPARTQRLFHLENARDNVSHRNEKPGNDRLNTIKNDMRNFLNGK